MHRNDFTEILRTVGRGPHLSRSLTLDEAERAMSMILEGETEPLQLGAFLLVLRYRTETPEEIAGFVRAARERLAFSTDVHVDLDWPSYADAHKQLPYFLLAALLLARNGISVVMHGIEGTGPARTPRGLEALGITPVHDAAGVSQALDRDGLAYVPLHSLCPAMAALFDLKPALGLRTCMHTAARELNPFRAAHQIQGVFHPTYLELHQRTQQLLGQPHAITFKGGGGEGQRNPCKPTQTLTLDDEALGEQRWECIQGCDVYPWRDEPLDPGRLVALWDGAVDLDAPRRAVTGTAAMCLLMLGRAMNRSDAEAMAEAMWLGRHSKAAA